MSESTNQNHRRYSARTFTRSHGDTDLVCPRCRATSREPLEECGKCGFSFRQCEKLFPFGAPPLSLVIDPSGLLPPGIEGDLDNIYFKVRKRFPQVDLSFCFVKLQPGVSTQEFAFWLHNAAPEAEESRAWQILLVGDLTSGRLAFTTGYAIEPFIRPEQWEAALQELAACVAEGEWKEGLSGFLIDARDLLTSAWASAQRKLKNSSRKRPGEGASPAAETNLPEPRVADKEVASAVQDGRHPEPAQPVPNTPAAPPPPQPAAMEGAATK